MPAADAPQTGKEFTSDQEVRWCPGCGDYAVLKAVQSFLPDLKLRREQGTLEVLEGVAAARGYKITTADHVERASLRLINDFQAGKLGKLSLEDPDTAQISSPIFRGGMTVTEEE